MQGGCAEELAMRWDKGGVLNRGTTPRENSGGGM